MRDALTLILLAVGLIGWILFFNEKGSRPVVTGRTSDTIWHTYTLQPKQPKPVLVKGETDTLTVIDSAAVDSVRTVMGDSLKFYQHLVRSFQLQYEDSMQKMSVGIDPIRKTGLFTPHYKPIQYLTREVNNTVTVSSDRWIQSYLGAGYQKRDSSHFYFFLDARIRINADLFLKPRISTDGIGAELEYKIY